MRAGSYGKSIFCFVKKTAKVFSKVSVTFCILINNERKCFPACSIPAFSIVSVLDFGYSERCAVVSHSFNLHFLDNT